MIEITILLEAVGIVFGAIIIGRLIKRKFKNNRFFSRLRNNKYWCNSCKKYLNHNRRTRKR